MSALAEQEQDSNSTGAPLLATDETTVSSSSSTGPSQRHHQQEEAPGDEASLASGQQRPDRPSVVVRPLFVNGTLILPQVIFGLGSVIAALGLPACNPLTFALYREVTAGVLLLLGAGVLLLATTRRRSFSSSQRASPDNQGIGGAGIISTLLEPIQKHGSRFALLGLAIYANQLGAITGIKLAGPVTAAVWQPSQPIMTSAICMAMKWEPWNSLRVLGVYTAFGGCVLMVVLDYYKHKQHDSRDDDGVEKSPVIFLVGNCLFFINCLGTSLYVILSKKVLRLYPTLVVTAWSYNMASLFMAITTLLASTSPKFMADLCNECTGPWYVIPKGAFFALAYFILFNSVTAYAIITWANNHATSTLVMGYTVLQPVTAALLTVLLLMLGAVSRCTNITNASEACLDPPGWGSMAGMVGVFAGLYLMIVTEPKGSGAVHYEPVPIQDAPCQEEEEDAEHVS